MRLSSFACCAAALFIFLPGSAFLPSHAQTFPAATGEAAVFSSNLPNRIPSALPPHHTRTDAPLIYARVRDGVYSVDGMVGKVRLNYDVKAASYFYLFMPGVGTALVSLAPSTDAVSVPAAYHDGQLTVRVAGHTFNLTGIESLVNDSGKEPAALYVTLNREAWRLSRRPMVGFGNAVQAPYEWPGALPTPPTTDAKEMPAPVPSNLLPRPTTYPVAANGMR